MNKYLKNKKALLCLMLVVAVMASIFVVMAMPTGAESVLESLDGATFSSTKYYTMQSPIAEHGSYTLEAEFYIDPTTADKDRVGNIIGNWHDDSTKRSGNEWTIELHYYGAVRLYHASGKSAFFHQGTDHTAAADAKNDGSVTDIRTYMTDENGNPAYAKITITVDTTTGDASLYVNGNCVKTITGSAAFKNRVYSVSAKNPNHIIGNDHRASKSASTFKGSIRNVAMYSYVRDVENTIYGEAFTATEKDPNLLFAYDLTELKVNGGYVNDYSSNGIKAVNTNWKIDNDSTGRTFTGNDSLFLSKELDVMPQTFEAVVYAPKSVSRPGVIFGNYHGGEAAINFELHTSR